ncbi:hypothetical protein EDD17DRAFT_1508682 [Pisolithus thermaeus]|nr:hypothetical protein EDD17DRAFT_1508682 [Pisolithus thermaeus]
MFGCLHNHLRADLAIYFKNPTVTSHGSQVHGQLKLKLCPLVKAMYRFHSSQSRSTIKKNWTLAEGLKEGTNFTFKDFPKATQSSLSRAVAHMAAEEDGQRSFLKAPLIQKVINTMWFANKHDDRVVFHKHFKPFPYPVLALELTALLRRLEENLLYCSPLFCLCTQMDIPFTIQEYHGTYKSHLKCLQAFEDATKTYDILPAICLKLIHSGTAPLSMPTEVTISAQVIAAAIKEHEEVSTMEDELD